MSFHTSPPFADKYIITIYPCSVDDRSNFRWL